MPTAEYVPRIPTDQIITTTASLDAAPSLVVELASRTSEQLKVVLRAR